MPEFHLETPVAPEAFDIARPDMPVPVDAFRFDAPTRFTFGDAEEGETKVRLLARTGDPVEHWYWGQIVHDFDGMVHADSIVLDWCHDDDDILGYADGFELADGELWLAGKLLHNRDGDRVSWLTKNVPRGVPMQASITARYDVAGDTPPMEFIPEDVSTEVNGREVAGPALIARRWRLIGTAICPHGRDGNTRTELSRGGRFVAPPQIFRPDEEAEPMPKPAPAADDKLTAGETDDARPDDVPAENSASGNESPGKETSGNEPSKLETFAAEFGNEKAAEYLLEKLSLEDARKRHAEHERTTADEKLSAAKAENDELRAKLDQVESQLAAVADAHSEETPVDTHSGGDPKKPSKFRRQLGDAIGSYAEHLAAQRDG
ncbi:MAG: hypothetical protein AAGJ97_05970 [Planctomycetota bacterium]